MKTHALPNRGARAALAAALLLASCQYASAISLGSSNHVPGHPASVPNLHQVAMQTIATHTETPAEVLLSEIQGTPFSARTVLRDKLKTSETRFSEKLPEWEAKKNALPSEKKSEAETFFKQLIADREILRQKIDGVENASAETWSSAKSELYTSLQNTISTYNKLKVLFDS